MTNSNWQVILQFSLASALFTFIATAFGVSTVISGINRLNRRFFMINFAILLLCMAAFLADNVSWRNPSMATVAKISIYFEYLSLVLPMPIFTAYLLHSCGEKLKSSAIFYAAIVVFIIFFHYVGNNSIYDNFLLYNAG